mmetsp:Transcript_2740/g.4160  ORF Transcript_2740/g.4160 Transcript_2740/m.4160 type:complete len:144 (+) Transcript_2740:77-508(+)
MRLSNLPSLGLASILFNALQSNAHEPTLLRGGQLPIPEAPSPEFGNELQDPPAIKDLYVDTFQLAGSNWRASNIRGALLRSDTDVTMFSNLRPQLKAAAAVTNLMLHGISLELLSRLMVPSNLSFWNTCVSRIWFPLKGIAMA